MKQQRVRLLVSGKVQGVFFRQALKVVAKKNNVSGWVRNLKDRRVEAVFEGDSNLSVQLLNGHVSVLQIHVLTTLTLAVKNLKMNFLHSKFCTKIYECY